MARNLLQRSSSHVGLDQKFWAIVETGGYGDDATGGLIPTATDAFGHLNGNIKFTIPRENSPYRSGRSVVSRLSGKKECSFSVETYIIPGVPDGSDHPTTPDVHPLLLAVFGSVDTSVATDRVYEFVSHSTSSFRLLEEGTHFSRLAVGCVADSLTISLPGDGKATFKFEGFAQDVYLAGQTVLASAAVATNNLTLTTGHGNRFEIGSYVDVIDKDDGTTLKATARKVTAKPSADVITVSGAAVTADQNDIIIGHAPDFTATDETDALLGLKGSFTLDSETIDCNLLSCEFQIKNNYEPRKNIYGTSKVCDFDASKRREVTVKLDVLLTNDNFRIYADKKNFEVTDLVVVLQPQDIPSPENPVLGRTVTISAPRVEFNVPSLDQPADGLIKISLEGICLAEDVNTPNGELYLVIT